MDSSGGPTSRKRLHPSNNEQPPDFEGDSFMAEAEEDEPRAKRGQHQEAGGSSPDEGALRIVEEGEDEDDDLLSDLPAEALHATSRAQFVHHMRPYMWVKFPSAMASEITAFINARWNLLKASKKVASGGKGERRRRSEVDTLGVELEDEGEGTSRSSRQRAAKRVAKNAYTMDLDEFEYADSPASSAHSSRDTGSTVGGGASKDKDKQKVGGRRKKRRRGRPPVAKEETRAEPRVPPMKIKMIGRSGESDSPIFFAESMESWDEASGSEKGGPSRKKGKRALLKERGLDSENSSLALGDEEEEEDEELRLLEGGSRPPSEGEEEEEEEVGHADSEGEHADYCHTCKDGGELLCCDFCPLAYHLKCLVPPMAAIPEDDWRCPRCEAEPMGAKIERIHTWRWTELPLEAGSSELEDNAMEEGKEGEGKETPKTETPKTYKIREYFVKWQGKSFWKNSWVSEIRVDVFQPITLRSYVRKHNMDTPPKLELPPHVQRRHKRRSTASFCDEKMEDLEIMLLKAGVRPQWLQIHRVINKRSSRKGAEYLVKWRDLSYFHSTWESLGDECGLKNAAQAIQAYDDLRRIMDPKKKKEKKRGRRAKFVPQPITRYEEQPECVESTGGTLHPYQLEGLNWLRFSWKQHTNTILADEMGLGKTIQTIAFLYSLVKEGRSNGPFLISAPLSTIVNWSREFEFWAPDLYVVTYTGDKDNRAAIREHEFSFVDGAVKKSNNRLFKMRDDAPVKFHVLLTSYEYITVDCTVLQSIGWDVLVVDEAHRLKNNQSKFFRFLSGYDIKYKLLLTGTPLQNNLEELFHLLNFLNPVGFDSLEQFQEEFKDLSKEDQVARLHDLLAPHLLRRLKADVLKNIPPKRELIVRVDLAPMQKKFYRYILTRNFEKLNTRGSQPVSLLNVMMDLKKCCNHPYLFPTASQEAPLTVSGYYQGKELVQASGKFLVMEKMLRRLKEQGHRVLIFSQMTRMLDILEDLMEYLGFKFERIDGSVMGSERQQSIDRFNQPNSEQFVFLLSTRAGGLGINLATADTVIIYDSDWNPHNDIQAFSRAHRIGQSNKVMIYRFVTRSSVEERITEVAKKKMMLTHLVVCPGMGSGGSAPSLSKRDLDDILRFGTEDLFKDESSSADNAIHYDDRTVEALLDRHQEGTDSVELPGSENLLANEYLSSFKVASYVTKEVQEEEEEEAETEILREGTDAAAQPDPDFWEKLLRHHYEQQRELEEAKLGKGKRIRKQVNYIDASEERGRESDQSSYQQSDERETESDSDAGQDFVVPGSKKRKGQNVTFSEGLPPLLAKAKGNLYVLGFNPRQRKAFLNSVMRFGMPPPNAFHANWKMRDLKSLPENAFNAYVNLFMRHLCEPDNPNSTTYSDGVPCEPVSRQNILTRIGIMRLVRNKVDQYRDINGAYSMGEPSPPPPPQEPVKPPLDASEPTVVQVSGSDAAPLDTTPQTGPPRVEVGVAESPMEGSVASSISSSSKDSSPVSSDSVCSAGNTATSDTPVSSRDSVCNTATSDTPVASRDSVCNTAASDTPVASQDSVCNAGNTATSDTPVPSQDSVCNAGNTATSDTPVASQDSVCNAGNTAASDTPPDTVQKTMPKTTPPKEEPVERMEVASIPATEGVAKVAPSTASADVANLESPSVIVSPPGKSAEAEAANYLVTVAPKTAAPLASVKAEGETAPLPGVKAEGGTVPLKAEGGTAPLKAEGGTAPLKAEGGTAPLKAEGGTAPLKAEGGTAPLPGVKVEGGTAPLPGVKRERGKTPKFMFNIADGGFTELHNVWADEKTKGFSPRLWGRHHDYWLLKGLVTHGYCRWSEICGDLKFLLLNKPFSDEAYMTDSKSRFLLKRFKLLEQALAVEEQLHRASNARLYQDPNHSVMQLHSRYTDLDCLADGHASLVSECLDGDKNSVLLMKKAVSKMEELLIEMKSDVSRLSNELAKIPSVSVQLKMDEISIISKLAKTPVSQSVIAHAPSAPPKAPLRPKSPAKVAKKDVMVGSDRKVAGGAGYAPPAQTGPQVQLPQVAMQTSEGLVMVAANSKPVSVVQAGTSSVVTTSAGKTIAIGVPTYLDGSSLYQLVPAVSGQQLMYWPPVVGGGQTPAQVTTVAATSGLGANQLAVLQGTTSGQGAKVGSQLTMLQGATLGQGAKVGSQLAMLQGATLGQGTKVGSQLAMLQGAKVGSQLAVLQGATLGQGTKVGSQLAVLQGATLGQGTKVGSQVQGSPAVLQVVGSKGSKGSQKSVITID